MKSTHSNKILKTSPTPRKSISSNTPMSDQYRKGSIKTSFKLKDTITHTRSISKIVKLDIAEKQKQEDNTDTEGSIVFSNMNEPFKKMKTQYLENDNIKDLIYPETGQTSLLDNETEKNAVRFKVGARFRPFNMLESKLEGNNNFCVQFLSADSVNIINNGNKFQITLDRIFGDSDDQLTVYNDIAKETINDVLKGYNGTIFTYGQSGSGKTYTMYGSDILSNENKGIIPRAIDHIFNFIESDKNKDIKFEIKLSVIEIYKEMLYDLLNPETKCTDLKIKEHPKKGIYVQNLTEEYISDKEEFLLYLEEADRYRSVSETMLNKSSSRSHLLLIVEITQKNSDDIEKKGILNLVDLAGSEKVSKSGAVGETLEEAKKINLSLSTLGNVISALTTNSKEYIPYRDSKLTRILQDSLGGNYKTTLIVNCSPHIYHVEETISTLKFAGRAKKIKNKVKINIKRSNQELENIVSKLSLELKYANEEIKKLKSSGYGFMSPNSSENVLEDKELEDKLVKLDKFLDEDSIHIIKNDEIMKKKDDEIINLRGEIEKLNDENENLRNKVDILTRENNINKNINHLEEIVKFNIKELNNIKMKSSNENENNLKMELRVLKENLSELNEKFIDEIKKIKILNQILNEEIDNQLEDKEFEVDDFSVYLSKIDKMFNKFGDSEKFTQTYKNIFHSEKFFLSHILDDFYKNRDYFKTLKIHNTLDKKLNNQIYEKNKNSKLKNSYIYSLIINMFYEKFFYDILNQAYIEEKKYHISYNLKKEENFKIDTMIRMLDNYMELVNELKANISNKSCHNCNNKEYTSSKFKMVKVVSKKSKMMSKRNLLEFREYMNEKIKEEDEDDIDRECLEKNLITDNMDANKNEMYRVKTRKVTNDSNKESIIDDIGHNLKTNTSYEGIGLKSLIAELNIYKNFVNILNTDNNKLKERENQFNDIIKNFQDNHKLIYEKEIQNFNTINNIFKNMMDEELTKRKNIIDKLSLLIEDILLNKGLLNENKNSNNNYKEYFLLAKKEIIDNNNNSLDIKRMAKSFIDETGTATRRMDSISFKIENQDCNDLKVSFESGLTCKFPGKSPLQKNLNVCQGDDGDHIDIDYV